MTVALIAAVSDNGVIGRNGALPWRLPDDLKRFRTLTEGHAVIMGRRTYESIGAPLDRRANFVLSRRRGYEASWARVIANVDYAMRFATSMGDVFVIGGAEVYAAALPYCERAYVTRVHTTVEGDNLTRFPCDLSAWRVVASERHEADARHAHPFTFETLVRP
mgnify:CR=1 FL=1